MRQDNSVYSDISAVNMILGLQWAGTLTMRCSGRMFALASRAVGYRAVPIKIISVSKGNEPEAAAYANRYVFQSSTCQGADFIFASWKPRWVYTATKLQLYLHGCLRGLASHTVNLLKFGCIFCDSFLTAWSLMIQSVASWLSLLREIPCLFPFYAWGIGIPVM